MDHKLRLFIKIYIFLEKFNYNNTRVKQLTIDIM